MYTFLFTDVEDSTQLWERQPQAMAAALAHHDAVMARTIADCKGKIFKTVGDGVYSVFDSAAQAVDAALSIQAQLHEASIRADNPLLHLNVRMGLYSGEAEARDGDYFGATLNRTARLLGACCGGQVLISAATRRELPDTIELRDLGVHRLRDLSEPEHVYQLVSSRFPTVTKAIQSLTPRPTNLPAQLTSFVGREDNVADACRRLRQPDVRLLTLMGPGGIGKTRLSQQIGASLLDEYEDGVFFVALASFRQPEPMLRQISEALGVPEEDDAKPIDSLKSYLSKKQMLVILDNFEQLVDYAYLINEVLMAAARVKVLVTSRESLYIYGEHTAMVPPLGLPNPDDDLSKIMASSAVALFIDRVRAILPDFVLDRSNAADVIEICRQVDGLPLAMELAAARARDLSLKEIHQQLGARLSLLDRGPRDLPKRQQTMRGAIEWSYELLARDDQRAFARLAVFEGEFFAQSASMVTGLGEMAMFVNKSLLHQTGKETYTLLAVLREYAAERLAEFGESEITREKHAIYYVQWLDMVQRFLNSPEQTEWFYKLGVEHYNLHAAFDWFVSNREYYEAGQLASVLWRFWAMQSQLADGTKRIAQVLDHADVLPPLVHARLMQGAGRLALLRYKYAESMEYQRKSLELFRSIGELAGVAALLLSMGETEYIYNNYITAENYLGESMAVFGQIRDEAGIGRCLNIMGRIMVHHKDYEKAQSIFEQGLALSRKYGSQEAIALVLYELADMLRTQKKYDEAQAHYRESLGLFRQIDLGIGVATNLYSLAAIEQAQGKLASAWALYAEALEMLIALEEPYYIGECLIGVAGALLLQDRKPLCIQALSAADAALTSIDAKDELSLLNKDEYQRIYDAVHSDDDGWRDAWSTGQTTPTDQFLRLLLREAKSVDAALSA